MSRTDGSLALRLNFGEVTTTATVGAPAGRARLRLAVPPGGLHGPQKYAVLEHRRRQAQIKARRLLEAGEPCRTPGQELR
jgi:hypothetical protein